MNGMMTLSCLVIALFFYRFSRSTGDRFFQLFSTAFFVLGVERIIILLSGGTKETHASVYLMRCVAFLIIIWAVIDKNRDAGRA